MCIFIKTVKVSEPSQIKYVNEIVDEIKEETKNIKNENPSHKTENSIDVTNDFKLMENPIYKMTKRATLVNTIRNKKALLIGINYTGTSNALAGCINDIIEIKQMLMDKYDFHSDNIRMLRDDDSHNLPTFDNIIRGIQWLIANAINGDKLFLHYSGHGSSIMDRNGDEDDRRDETICPIDFQRKGMITDDELREILIDPLPEGVRLTILMDCCHSGTVCDLRYNYLTNKANLQGRVTEIRKNINHPQTKCDVIMISGCRDNQTSADGWGDGKAQGAMTYCFKEAIENNTYPSYKKLMDELRQTLKQRGYNQVPQLSSGKQISLNETFNPIF